MSKCFEIDYAVGYEFNLIEKMVIKSASDDGISIDDYLEHAKTAFKNLGRSIMMEIAKSHDVQYISDMIDEINDARCEWTTYDRYDFERKLKPEQR
jgi:hypothetical protein